MNVPTPRGDSRDDTAAGLDRLRREVRFLKAYAGGMTLALALLLLCGAEAVRQRPKFDEVDVERLNIVEKDGRLRLVLSNRARAPDVITDGKSIKPRRGPRPAGMYFYGDRGECGGLVFGTSDGGKDGRYYAGSALLFDQYRQDQTVGIMYNDETGRRSAGLHVWDRPDTPMWKLAEKLEAIDKLPEGHRKQEALRELRESSPSASRVFVGKSQRRAAEVVLADGKGRPRIRLSVDADGGAGLEFLDEGGKVVRRLAPEEKTR
jgi:hypothetical protein